MQVELGRLSKNLTASLSAAVTQLLGMSDSDLADAADDSADDSGEIGEVFTAKAAILRAYHLMMVCEPSSAVITDDIIKTTSQLLEVCWCCFTAFVMLHCGQGD